MIEVTIESKREMAAIGDLVNTAILTIFLEMEPQKKRECTERVGI